MSSLVEIISLTFIILLLNLMVNNADERVGPKEGRSHSAVRRVDCQLFCKKTGFNGIFGGCQCGFTLFSSKRSETNDKENIGNSAANKMKKNSNYRMFGSLPLRFSQYSNDPQFRNIMIPFTTRQIQLHRI